MLQEYISVDSVLSTISDLPETVSMEELKEMLKTLPVHPLYPCKNCPSYEWLEGNTQEGRCKRIGFFFNESFSCGYSDSNEKRARLRF